MYTYKKTIRSPHSPQQVFQRLTQQKGNEKGLSFVLEEQKIFAQAKLYKNGKVVINDVQVIAYMKNQEFGLQFRKSKMIHELQFGIQKAEEGGSKVSLFYRFQTMPANALIGYLVDFWIWRSRFKRFLKGMVL